MVQFLAPNCATNRLSTASSSGDQGPLTFPAAISDPSPMMTGSVSTPPPLCAVAVAVGSAERFSSDMAVVGCFASLCVTVSFFSLSFSN